METITEGDLIRIATSAWSYGDPSDELMQWLKDVNHWRLMDVYSYRVWYRAQQCAPFSLTEGSKTMNKESLIERQFERAVDKLDRDFMAGKMNQEQYDSEYEALVDSFAHADFCDSAYGRD